MNIIYDGKYEQLNGGGLLDVRTEIVSKVWQEAEDSPGSPLVHFIARSDIGRRIRRRSDPRFIRVGGAWVTG